MKNIFTLFLILFSFNSFSQDISIGNRDSLNSNILNQEREFSVYLPPGYHSAPAQNYPVLYIVDGDYNFQYVAGLLELEGGISERIPEMILIAISGKDTETYRNNCRPNIEGIEDKGNADKMAQFIAEELIPYVNSNYNTNDFKILSGHSLGGLFSINTALQFPEMFDRYIAISPALWWGENAINQVAEEKTKARDFNAKVYISLANEEGMGVDSFLGAATSSILKNNIVTFGIGALFVLFAIIWGIKSKKIVLPILLALVGIGISAYLYFLYYPENDHFKFKQFAKENHNSVGEPTYRWALEDIFETWRVKEQYFSSSEELTAHYQKVKEKYGSSFNIPYTVLGNTDYILQDNETERQALQTELKTNYPLAFETFTIYHAEKLLEKEPKKAGKLAKEVLGTNPNSFDAQHVLAKVKLAENKKSQARALINKALETAKEQNTRQWKINELIGTREKIEKE